MDIKEKLAVYFTDPEGDAEIDLNGNEITRPTNLVEALIAEQGAHAAVEEKVEFREIAEDTPPDWREAAGIAEPEIVKPKLGNQGPTAGHNMVLESRKALFMPLGEPDRPELAQELEQEFESASDSIIEPYTLPEQVEHYQDTPEAYAEPAGYAAPEEFPANEPSSHGIEQSGYEGQVDPDLDQQLAEFDSALQADHANDPQGHEYDAPQSVSVYDDSDHAALAHQPVPVFAEPEQGQPVEGYMADEMAELPVEGNYTEMPATIAAETVVAEDGHGFDAPAAQYGAAMAAQNFADETASDGFPEEAQAHPAEEFAHQEQPVSDYHADEFGTADSVEPAPAPTEFSHAQMPSTNDATLDPILVQLSRLDDIYNRMFEGAEQPIAAQHDAIESNAPESAEEYSPTSVLASNEYENSHDAQQEFGESYQPDYQSDVAGNGPDDVQLDDVQLDVEQAGVEQFAEFGATETDAGSVDMEEVDDTPIEPSVEATVYNGMDEETAPDTGCDVASQELDQVDASVDAAQDMNNPLGHETRMADAPLVHSSAPSMETPEEAYNEPENMAEGLPYDHAGFETTPPPMMDEEAGHFQSDQIVPEAVQQVEQEVVGVEAADDLQQGEEPAEGGYKFLREFVPGNPVYSDQPKRKTSVNDLRNTVRFMSDEKGKH